MMLKIALAANKVLVALGPIDLKTVDNCGYRYPCENPSLQR